MQHTLKFLIPFIFICSICSAAPSVTGVSGTVAQDEAVVINGSAFGTKSTAAPLVWDNFESGTNNAQIEGASPVVGTAWEVYTSGSTKPVYDTSVSMRTNSSVCARNDFYLGPDYDVCLAKTVSMPSAGSEVFASFYWRYHKRSTNYADNNKPFIIWHEPDGTPMTYTGFGDPGVGDGALRAGVEDSPGPSNDGPGYGDSDLADLNDTWARIDMYLKQSTASTNDGEFKTWINNSLKLNDTSVSTRTGADLWNFVLIGAFIRQNQPVQVYIDDVYIDNTLSRVEIGDNATFANCTHREIQIPSAWSNTEITVTVNAGSFVADNTAYLFVVDSNGVASAGYEVTIGGESEPPPAETGGTASAQITGRCGLTGSMRMQ